MEKNLAVIEKEEFARFAQVQLSNVVEPVMKSVGEYFEKMEKESQVHGYLEVETGHLEINYENKTINIKPYKMRMCFDTIKNNAEVINE